MAAALKRVKTPPRTCEKHSAVEYADEFANVRRRLRVLRLALSGGPVLLEAVGLDGDRDENIRDAHAVLDLAEELERTMEDFIQERERCPVCSPERA